MHTSRAARVLPREPWRDMPCSRIICEQDQVLPPAIQDLVASKMGGPDIAHRLLSLYAPFLSMPDRLADVLR